MLLQYDLINADVNQKPAKVLRCYKHGVNEKKKVSLVLFQCLSQYHAHKVTLVMTQ